MAEKIRSSDAKRLIDIHRSVAANLEAVVGQKSALAEEVIAAAEALTREETHKMLQTIPVEEINRDKKGFRVKVLHDSGYHTIADLQSLSLQQLIDVDGIGEDSARMIESTVKDICSTAESNVRIKLSTDNKSPAASALVLALSKYRLAEPYINESRKLHEKSIANVSMFIQNLLPATNSIKWLFMSEAKKTNVINAYNVLERMLEGVYGQTANSIFAAFNKLNNLSFEEAWRDFSQNSISFFKLLEDLVPGFLNDDETIYGLPEDVAEDVRSQEYSTDGLHCELRRYQEWGVKYILRQKRVLLGDEMGLGKTVQAIAAIVSLRNSGETHFMVVCPASVLSNWCREIKKMSDLSVHKVHGSDRMASFERWKDDGGVAVTTYETTGALAMDEDFGFSMLIVDEAHYIKNPDAKRTRNVTEICNHSENLLFMTGTALENKVEEMVSLIRILQPQIASKVHGMEFLSSAPQFREAIAPVYYRRKREDVLTELPELIETQEWCSMNAIEEKAYESAVLSGNFMAARRVSWNVDDLKDSSKASRLLEIIEEATEEGRKIIVFSYFTDTISKVQSLCGTQCYGPINGSVAPQRRQEIIDEFDKAPEGAVLVAQIQAGGTGLNIQSASVVVICEPQFKPSIENQAIARAYRMGQTRNVLVFRLLCEDSVDEKIIELLENKQEIFDAFADDSVAADQNIELDEKSFGNIIREEAERIGAKHNTDKPDDAGGSEPQVTENDTVGEDITDEPEDLPADTEGDGECSDSAGATDNNGGNSAVTTDTADGKSDTAGDDNRKPKPISLTKAVVSFLKRSAAEFNELFTGELADDEIECVYEGLTDYDFHGVNVLEDEEKLDEELEAFEPENWEKSPLETQKEKILELAHYIIDVIGLENPPEILFYDGGDSGTYGSYSDATNTLRVNERTIFQSDEAADTIAHELWHAYQFQRASNPQTKLDYMYLENFNDYITPEEDFEGYQSQLLESEARAFAEQIKKRIKFYKGESYGTDFELPDE